jgi:hypothetical protein
MTSITLSIDTLTIILLGAVLIITGMSLTNSVKQKGQTPNMLGSLLSLGGWAVIAFGLDFNVWAMAGIAAIIASIIMKEMEIQPMLFTPLFVIGWLLIAYAVSNQSLDFTDTRFLLAYGAVISIIISILVVLPIERAQKITDTLSMPLFTGGWFMLAAAAALQ